MKKIKLISSIMLLIIALSITAYPQNKKPVTVQSETQNSSQLKEPLIQEYSTSFGTLTTMQVGDSLPMPVEKVRYAEEAITTSDGGTATFISFKTNEQSLNETQAEAEIKVYPNPFTYSATLQTTKPLQNATLSIYDILGKEIKRINNINGTEIKISSGDMKSGMYFFTLIDEKGFVGNGKMLVE